MHPHSIARQNYAETMSGFVGDLSPREEHALEQVYEMQPPSLHLEELCEANCTLCLSRFLQLRSALREVEEVAGKDDHYFLRWLRVRKFNVAEAEDMLRKVRVTVLERPMITEHTK